MAEWDAVVVGGGPNGLAAACELARNGSQVLLIEGAERVGGGCRTASLIFDDHLHDVCAAIHAFGPLSPFFRSLPLEDYGVRWIEPDLALSHPFEDGSAAYLHSDLDQTVAGLGGDGDEYRLMVESFDGPAMDIALGPVWRGIRSPVRSLRIASVGLRSAQKYASRFSTRGARGLFAGLAAHSMASLDNPLTAGVGAVLAASAHRGGWPFVAGGSQNLADGLAEYFKALGGTIQTGLTVRSESDLPTSKVVLFDLVPSQVASILGEDPTPSRRSVSPPGPAAFKVDWVVASPIPWRDAISRRAGTVHLGGSFEQVADAEKATANGSMPERPFVLIAQPSLFDSARAPQGRHIVWGYCHVPAGFSGDATAAIESQIERYAPGFADTIVARHVMGPAALEAYNPNYVGGDITGGPLTLRSLIGPLRSPLDPYRIPATDWFVCSSATPPGAGVHGMCGYHAARSALRHLASM